MDLLDRLVVAFDRRQRRRLHIWEFSDDPGCILRVSITRSRVEAELADRTVVRRGDRIGIIHLWNERMPRIPDKGADLEWATTLARSVVYSLRLLTHCMLETPDLDGIQAFGGEFGFVYTPVAIRFLRRIGVEVFEPRPPSGLAEWVEDIAMRIWPWLLRRVFNPESIRGRTLDDMRRRPVWISRNTLLRLYGPGAPPPDARSEPRAAP
jgi:hypothetical protein